MEKNDKNIAPFRLYSKGDEYSMLSIYDSTNLEELIADVNYI